MLTSSRVNFPCWWKQQQVTGVRMWDKQEQQNIPVSRVKANWEIRTVLVYSNGGFVLNGNCKKTSLEGKAYIIKNMLFNWFFAYGFFSGVGLGIIGYFRQFESYQNLLLMTSWYWKLPRNQTSHLSNRASTITTSPKRSLILFIKLSFIVT